jgi:ankyrin repeat protein
LFYAAVSKQAMIIILLFLIAQLPILTLGTRAALDANGYAIIDQEIPGINDVDAEGNTVLMRAAGSGQLDFVKNYLAAGARTDVVNHVGNTPLMVAIKNSFYYTAIELIKHSNLTHRNMYGMTPMLMAIASGQYELVGAMLDNNTDANIALRDGTSALMIAGQRGATKIVKRLLEKGAHINLTCATGENSLMFAATFGHGPTTELLLEYGSEKERKNNQGFTAMMLAASRGHVSTLKSLLKFGCRLNERDQFGRSPIDHAIQSDNQDAIEYLASIGADLPTSGYRVSALVMAERRKFLELHGRIP